MPLSKGARTFAGAALVVGALVAGIHYSEREQREVCPGATIGLP
jgi:hypothetical protein